MEFNYFSPLGPYVKQWTALEVLQQLAEMNNALGGSQRADEERSRVEQEKHNDDQRRQARIDELETRLQHLEDKRIT